MDDTCVGECMDGMRPELRLHTERRTVTLCWQRTEVTILSAEAILKPGVSVDELIYAVGNGGRLEMDKAGPSGGSLCDCDGYILASFNSTEWLDYDEENNDIEIERESEGACSTAGLPS